MDVGVQGEDFVVLPAVVEGVARKGAGFEDTEEWNTYLSGDVWGYRVFDEDGEEFDSYWGFYGREACIEEAKAVDRAWKALELRRPVPIQYPATW